MFDISSQFEEFVCRNCNNPCIEVEEPTDAVQLKMQCSLLSADGNAQWLAKNTKNVCRQRRHVGLHKKESHAGSNSEISQNESTQAATPMRKKRKRRPDGSVGMACVPETWKYGNLGIAMAAMAF